METDSIQELTSNEVGVVRKVRDEEGDASFAFSSKWQNHNNHIKKAEKAYGFGNSKGRRQSHEAGKEMGAQMFAVPCWGQWEAVSTLVSGPAELSASPYSLQYL